MVALGVGNISKAFPEGFGLHHLLDRVPGPDVVSIAVLMDEIIRTPTFSVLSDSRFTSWSALSSAICDAIITSSVYYYLRPARTGIVRKGNIIKRLNFVFIQMGLLSFINALAVVLLYSIQDRLLGQYLTAAPGIILGKSYVNSMLAVSASKKLHLNVAEKHSSSENEDVSDEFKVAPEPTNKHSKGTRLKGTSSEPERHGKLWMLPELNLDVLLHIFTFLLPMDLLNLARTTKAFRRLLMQKSSAPVWEAARRQTEHDLPDCPPDLSEPQYANLAFDPHCHNCWRLAHTIHWQLRRRYCLECRKKCLRRPGGRVPMNVSPMEFLNIGPGRVEWVVDIKQHDKLVEEYDKISIDKRDEFVAQKKRMVSDINEHAGECRQWLERVNAVRSHELYAAQVVRQESIISRLKDIGYEPEINYFSKDAAELKQDPIFKSSKQLTEREWQYVLPRLIQIMDGMRQKRMKIEVHNARRNLLTILYNDYRRNHAPIAAFADLLPSLHDVVNFVPFYTIVKLPADVNVDKATFKPAFDQLPTLTGEWKARAEAQLASLVTIPTNLPAAEESTDSNQEQERKSSVERLKLASAVFEVKLGSSRGELLTYPDIMAHPVFDGHFRRHGKALRVWSLIDSRGNRVVELLRGASHVVRLCGLDPHTATVDDMDRRNPRLICTQCDHGEQTVGVYTWKNALQHIRWHVDQMPSDLTEEEQHWEVLADNLVPMVEALEEPTVFVPPSCTLEVCCAMCRRRHVGAPRFSLPRRRHFEECSVSEFDSEEDEMEEEGPPCELEEHLINTHYTGRTLLIEGVHYVHAEPSIAKPVSKVFMTKNGDAVSFKAEKAQ
ncbi:hypothetical protein PAXINDRAFT_101915 [Paxillus involutus ATCC 200175]|uniref:Unplaced genomic scaffold PAXINscaffold_74, whole genome shotgun sequence n=1 Tax=Paxillus involutus ATCC 200175 TaxID=664439 RepID=A0A0C9T522_PAXIN|nr:hypothetical protein PAXINDRAFT_101915 [Paxillus involutus ATCC 200175]